MIKDRIENITRYENISAPLGNAIRTLRKGSFLQELRAGGRIDGEGFFATLLEYETKPAEEGKWETHRGCIDIQYLLSGEEMTGYTHIQNLEDNYECDPERDFYFYRDAAVSDYVTVRKGEFVIFFPEDGHKPSLYADNKKGLVQKIVVKVGTTERKI